MSRELGFLGLEGLDKRPWIGVVTDGFAWHAWRYAHEPRSVGREIFTGFKPNSPIALASTTEVAACDKTGPSLDQSVRNAASVSRIESV